jgi:hypothetical protein
VYDGKDLNQLLTFSPLEVPNAVGRALYLDTTGKLNARVDGGALTTDRFMCAVKMF